MIKLLHNIGFIAALLLLLLLLPIERITAFQIIHHRPAAASTTSSTNNLALQPQAFPRQPARKKNGNTNELVRRVTTTTTTTTLSMYKENYQFNGGYDASNLVSAKWTPLEAVEFVIWHVGDDFEAVGSQLKPLLSGWEGKDFGEFLTRLYLGETNDDFEVTFESKNVRHLRWKGLETDAGLLALKDLLSAALPTTILENPVEIARLAEVFLWKEHTWPSENSTTTDGGASHELEVESLASLGHTTAIVNILKELSNERQGCEWTSTWSIDNVLEMIPNPQKEWGKVQLHGMLEFFTHMEIRLSSTDKVELVQGMAHNGWGPARIAKFVSTFPELIEDNTSIEEEGEEEEDDTILSAEAAMFIENDGPSAFDIMEPTTDSSDDNDENEDEDGDDENKQPTLRFKLKQPDGNEQEPAFQTAAAMRINMKPTVASAIAADGGGDNSNNIGNFGA